MLTLEEDALLAALQTARAVRVCVDAVSGSVPRDAGTWMGVVDGSAAPIGTIGGGRVEHEATAHARALLGGVVTDTLRRMPLGPTLGQCCGGVMTLRFELYDPTTAPMLRRRFDAERRADMPIALFGGGHVGSAIVRALAPLPLRLHWVDSRDPVFPSPTPLGLAAWPRGLTMEHSDPVQRAVTTLAPGSRVLVMSYSHAEDFDILCACLHRQRARGDLPYIGLIGSKTKWAGFRAKLEARGFTAAEIAGVTCPIGLQGVEGKEPAVIAAAVALQLLATRGVDGAFQDVPNSCTQVANPLPQGSTP